ncbi:MAG: TonB-dependent receptor [Cyclobacteriaceae bacterium]
MRQSIFLLLLSLSVCTFGQADPCTRTVDGRILDLDTKEPLPFATITVNGTTNGTIADADGHFLIENICGDEIDLEIRFLGYKTLVHHHDFHHSFPVIYLATDRTLLESVVVEEERNAHELKTLSPKSIQIESSKSIGSTAGDLLSQATGVYTLRTGQNVVKPIVHGLHSNRVLIINNGVRHSYQAWGTEHAPEIDPSQVEKIQLIKGASTVRYGSDALGGVILFDALKPQFNINYSGEINTGVQSNGRGFGADGFFRKGFKRHAFIASINGFKQGDLKAPNYHLTNTGKKEVGYSFASRHHFPWIDIDLYANHFTQELGILRGSVNGNLTDLANAISAEIPNDTRSFSYEIRTPRQETVHNLLKIKSSIFVGEQQFDFQYAFQRNERREFDIRRGTNNERPSINLLLDTHSIDLDWDHSNGSNWTGTSGLQFFYQDNNNIPGTNTIPFVPNYNNLNLGVFAIESYSKERTTYEAGIRFDLSNLNVRGRDSSNDLYQNELDYQNLSFTVGLVHQFNDEVSVRTNLGSAWRAPNVNELYSFGKHQNIVEFGLWRYQIIQNDSIFTSGVLTDDEKNVKSEQGLKWISSINLQKEGFQAEITPYVNFIKNYFFIRPYGLTNTVRGTFPYFIHDQTDALYTGVDIDIRKIWENAIETELKASYVFAKDLTNDQPFIGIPPFNIQIEAKKKVGNFEIQLSPSWTASQSHAPPVIPAETFVGIEEISFSRSATFDFLAPPKSFFLLNASIRWTLNDLSVTVTGENLSNTSYRRYTDQSRYFADDLSTNLKLFFNYTF